MEGGLEVEDQFFGLAKYYRLDAVRSFIKVPLKKIVSSVKDRQRLSKQFNEANLFKLSKSLNPEDSIDGTKKKP